MSILFTGAISAQTHLTINNEKCWLFNTIVDTKGDSFQIVIVKTGEIENEKQKVETILKNKDKTRAETQLRNEGFRIEIFQNADITPIKRKML